MVGTQVERQGIIRHGAKMITAVSEATVPKICVIVRKAYGAGLYAMAGPAFGSEAVLALPTAKIAVMGPEAAVNAVYANRIAAIEDEAEREAFVTARRAEYIEDVDLLRLASEMIVDAVVAARGPARRADRPVRAWRAAATATSPIAATACRRYDRLASAIREVGPRDGLQAEDPVSVDDRIALIDALSGCGLHGDRGGVVRVGEGRAVDGGRRAGHGRHHRAAKACAYFALVPNVRGAEAAVEAGVDALTVTVSASETYSQKNTKAVDRRVGGVGGRGHPRFVGEGVADRSGAQLCVRLALRR